MGLYMEQEIEKYNMDQAIIWIDDEIITKETAKRVLSCLNFYKDRNYNRVNILIASPGGSADAAFAIRNKIRVLQKEGVIIATYIVFSSASAATVISSSGSLGFRYIDPSVTATIHSVSTTISGEITSVERQVRASKRVQDELVKHYVEVSNKSEKEIIEAISFDNEMTATEFVNFGLADKVDIY